MEFKNGTRLESIVKCDKLCHICCALHDSLLLHDELDEKYEGGTSFYDEFDTPSSVPFSVQRLTSYPSEKYFIRCTDYPENYFNQCMVHGKRVVTKMLLKVFQERLMHNFDTHFKNNNIE